LSESNQPSYTGKIKKGDIKFSKGVLKDRQEIKTKAKKAKKDFSEWLILPIRKNPDIC